MLHLIPTKRARSMHHRSVFNAIGLVFFIWLTWKVINRTPYQAPLPVVADSSAIATSVEDTVEDSVEVAAPIERPNPACRSLPGANHVVAVLRTGSTELAAKLPTHLNTTVQCFDDYLIFSDHEEHFMGEHILDVLDSVSPKIKEEHQDFEIWRRLRDGGREILDKAELGGPENKPHGGLGKDDNPGWKLDKWKFLPMMNRTLFEFPNKRWYLFLEPDTFVFWSSALDHLAKLDWTQPHYLGSAVQIGDDTFAHGGSGFAVSRPALQAVVNMFEAHQQEWEEFTDGHWAGDCVLGKAFLDSGTPLMWAAPIWNGQPISQMDYYNKDNLCRPSVSYHHMSPPMVEGLWDFEQQWLADHKSEPATIRHIDVLAHYVLPQTQKERYDWDNGSEDDEGENDSLEACRVICQEKESCLQYAVKDSHCKTSTAPNVGSAATGIKSGWIHDRVKQFVEDAPICSDDGWILD